MNRRINEILQDRRVIIHRTEVGNFLTTQEMAGCSVTLMQLDEELKRCLDAPTITPAYERCPSGFS